MKLSKLPGQDLSSPSRYRSNERFQPLPVLEQRKVYRRFGRCNLCGECCGEPRPDGSQNNPWPSDWPEAVQAWTAQERERLYPLFRIISPDQRRGVVRIDDEIVHWVWIPGEGLCTEQRPYGAGRYNRRCPFLSKKLLDGTTPCLLRDTQAGVWPRQCNLIPPPFFETFEEVERWQARCPSCSFEFFQEEIAWPPL